MAHSFEVYIKDERVKLKWLWECVPYICNYNQIITTITIDK